MILYTYFRSSASFRVRIALHWKQLPCSFRYIDLTKGEQKKETYLKQNPTGEVPCLLHGERVLSQSMIIMEYLEREFPQTPGLFPHQPPELFLCKEICEIVNSGIQPLQNLKVRQYLDKNLKLNKELQLQWNQHWIKEGLRAVEQRLTQHNFRFCAGSTPSAADMFLIPQVITALRFEVSMEPYPRIKEVFRECLRKEAFQKAHPFRQEDTPSNLKSQPIESL